MPPNRKAHYNVDPSFSLMDVGAFVTKSQFLTLTQDVETPSLQKIHGTSHFIDTIDDNASKSCVANLHKASSSSFEAACDLYWYDPSDRKQFVIDRILEEERIRELLSVDHIVCNLAAEVHPHKNDSEESKSSVDDDAYWSMATVEESAEIAKELTSTRRLLENLVLDESSRHSSLPLEDASNAASLYWEWLPTEERDRLIQSILAEERARELVQVDRIEMLLIEESLRARSMEQNQNSNYNAKLALVNPARKDDDYWRF